MLLLSVANTVLLQCPLVGNHCVRESRSLSIIDVCFFLFFSLVLSTSDVSEDRVAFAVTKKSADEESPDVIVIKDEEESEECSVIDGDGSHNTGPGIDTRTEFSNDQTLNIPSQEQKQDDNFYTTSEPLAFTSSSTMPTVSQDPTMTPSNNEHVRMVDIFGMSITNQLERTQSIQAVSMPLNQNIGVDFEGSSSSLPNSKQQKPIPKMLSCNVCLEQFNTRSELNAHRASHTGDSPVTCDMCDKVFVSKNTLTIHMRIHTGVKPYVCLLCGKRFTQNGGLRIHLRTHSGEKPFTCAVCQTSFNNPSNLRRHMITHNSV